MSLKFWQRLRQLFSTPPVEESAPKGAADDEEEELLLHEVLQRSKQEQAAFAEWQKSERARGMLRWLGEEYDKYLQKGKNSDKDLDFIAITSIDGFVIQYNAQRWDSEDFQHFFDYLKECLRRLGYWQQLADVRSVRRAGRIHTNHRYYLKPPRSFENTGKPAPQYFGNVMICLCMDNEKLKQLKFSATAYNDRLFAPALDFRELMATITHIAPSATEQ